MHFSLRFEEVPVSVRLATDRLRLMQLLEGNPCVSVVTDGSRLRFVMHRQETLSGGTAYPVSSQFLKKELDSTKKIIIIIIIIIIITEIYCH